MTIMIKESIVAYWYFAVLLMIITLTILLQWLPHIWWLGLQKIHRVHCMLLVSTGLKIQLTCHWHPDCMHQTFLINLSIKFMLEWNVCLLASSVLYTLQVPSCSHATMTCMRGESKLVYVYPYRLDCVQTYTWHRGRWCAWLLLLLRMSHYMNQLLLCRFQCQWHYNQVIVRGLST